MKHTIKEWFAVTRYWSFPVSAMPVAVCFAYLFSRGLVPDGIMPWVRLVLSLIGIVVLHAAGNVLSDYKDYKSGVDNERAFAVPNLVFKKFEPREYLVFSILLFIIGIAIGLVITLLSGTGLLIVGGVGVLLTLLYSFLKYHALGDLDIFLIFGVLSVLGTTYAVTGVYVYDALLLALPVGIITVSVLHANNTFDTVSDGEAGIKTFGMLLGLERSAKLYCCYMVLPFLCVAFYLVVGWLHPLSVLSLIAVVPAYKNYKQAAQYKTLGLDAMKGLDIASSKLQMTFSGSLTIALMIAGLI